MHLFTEKTEKEAMRSRAASQLELMLYFYPGERRMVIVTRNVGYHTQLSRSVSL